MTLEHLGLAPGERVRFRRRPRERWREARVVGVEKDGSLALREPGGAARAIPVELVQVRAVGPRGAQGWEEVRRRAARPEQLRLV